MTQAVPYQVADLIVAQLTTITTSAAFSDVLVLRADSLERIPRNVPRALIVIPGGIRVDDQTRNQAAIAEELIVVVAARNASTPLTGEASQTDAGALLGAVVAALLGWIPGEPWSPLVMTSSPAPNHESGYGYYPLAFETTYVLTGVSL